MLETLLYISQRFSFLVSPSDSKSSDSIVKIVKDFYTVFNEKVFGCGRESFLNVPTLVNYLNNKAFLFRKN